MIFKILNPVLWKETAAEAGELDMNPQNWFKKFTIPDGFGDALTIFKDAIASLKVIGFSVAFAATTIYFIGYYVSGTPQKRAEYKSRVMLLYILVMVLFGGLGIADMLYGIAVSIGGGAT